MNQIEKHKLLHEFNQTETAYPKDKCVHCIFEEQAKLHPSKIAIKYLEKKVTYQEVNTRANQMANYLQSLTKDSFIGVFAPRTNDSIVAFIAILKMGSAYVPLDPGYPTEHLSLMIKDTSISVILTYKNIEHELPPHNCKVVYLDSELSSFSSKNLSNTSSSSSLSYIMYTSGSTGVPKGIQITHKGIVRLVKNTNYIDIKEKHTIAQISNISFDASTFEIWGAFLNASTLAILPPETVMNPQELEKAFSKMKIDIAWITTSLFNQLILQIPEIFANLEYVLTGGESANIDCIKKAMQNGPQNLINIYGPTENTSFSSYHYVKNTDSSFIPIGRPVANTQIYILSNTQELVPIGDTGEIYLGGDGLATSYFNKPEITQKSFIPNPFPNTPGKILYKTGDLARYDKDGKIEFIGRADYQVKIRGFRIELGEIEAKLLSFSKIEQAIVSVNENNNDKKLIAYIQSTTTSEKEIRQFLKEKLPYYMMPSHFFILEKFPINNNGKTNRKALPKLENLENIQSSYTVYGNELETKISQTWQKLLSLSNIQMDSNFFDLGGNSLLATQFIFEMQKEFNYIIPLESFYQNPTISHIKDYLNKNNKNDHPHVILLKSGSSTPLFLVPDLAGDTASYGAIIKNLSSNQKVFGFRPMGFYEGEKPLKSIKKMATFYSEIVKQIQPKGPYMFGGLSMAGSVAYEMAQKFTSQNEQVNLLVLLDTDSGISFKTNTRKSSIKLIKSAWHNLMYWTFRPKKLNNALLDDLCTAVKLIWQLEISKQTLSMCQTEEEQYELLLKKLKEAKRFPPYITLEQFKNISDMVGFNYLATLAYFPKKYYGTTIFFKPQDKSDFFTIIDYQKWKKLIPTTLKIIDIPGNHFNFFLDPSAKKIGTNLQEIINNMPNKQ